MNISVPNSFLYNTSFKAHNSDKKRHQELMRQIKRDKDIRDDYFEKNYSKSANTKRTREGRMQYIVPVASTVAAIAIALGITSGLKDGKQSDVKYPVATQQPAIITEVETPTETPLPFVVVEENMYETYSTGLNQQIQNIGISFPEFLSWYPNTSYTTMDNELNKLLNGDFSTTPERTPPLKNFISSHLMRSFFSNLENTNNVYIANGKIPADINLVEEVIELCNELTDGEVSPNLVFALMNQTSRGQIKDTTMGATGLMQVSQVAEEHMNKKYFSSNPKYRHNPLDNLALGIKYIHYLQNELDSKYSGDELIQRIVIGYKDGHTIATKDFDKINKETLNYAQRTNCFYNCLIELK